MSRKYPHEPIKVPRFEETKGFYTTNKRSRQMSKIRGKDTQPELLFRKALYEAGVRYRLHVKALPGNPDLANASRRFAIFIDGEFWHGYNWGEKRAKIQSNRAFWIPKIERNMQRDAENNQKLNAMGYRLFRFWSNEVKQGLGTCLKQVLDYLAQEDYC